VLIWEVAAGCGDADAEVEHLQRDVTTPQDGQMDHNIDRLRYAALELLIRLSKRFPKKRASTIFLVNNLHHIVQVAPCKPLYTKNLSTYAVFTCQAVQARIITLLHDQLFSPSHDSMLLCCFSPSSCRCSSC